MDLPPLGSVWNVDTELFEIVPAVPDLEPVGEVRVPKNVEEEEEFGPQFIALPAVPMFEDSERSRGLDFEDVDNDNVIYEEYLDIINCEFDCVTKFCSSGDERCSDDCYQFCSRNLNQN